MDSTVKTRYEFFFPSELHQAVPEAPIAYIPAGSLEWHGEHLPLGCDFLRGHEICLRTAELAGGIVLPPIYVAAAGYSAYHGSIVFSAQLVTDFTLELLRELEKIGFRLAVIVLGHAGIVQEQAFEKAASLYQETNQMRVLVVEPWTYIEIPPDTGGHAGPYETGECLAAAPGSVDLSRFDPSATKLPKYEGLDREPYKRGTSPEGIEDTDRHMSATQWQWEERLPELATAEAGQKWMAETAAALAAVVKDEADRL